MRRIVLLLLSLLLSVSGRRTASEQASRKMLSSRKGHINWSADWKYRLDDSNQLPDEVRS